MPTNKEPIIVYLPKGGRKALKSKSKNAKCKSVNEYAVAMLMDGKVNKKPK